VGHLKQWSRSSVVCLSHADISKTQPDTSRAIRTSIGSRNMAEIRMRREKIGDISGKSGLQDIKPIRFSLVRHHVGTAQPAASRLSHAPTANDFAYCDQGRRGGQGVHAPSEIATLNFFLSLNSMEFVTFNQVFSIFFVFLKALPQTPLGALSLYGSCW